MATGATLVTSLRFRPFWCSIQKCSSEDGAIVRRSRSRSEEEKLFNIQCRMGGGKKSS